MPSAASTQGVGPGSQWVVFTVEAVRYGLPLAAVERIIRAVEVTPLPLAPAPVLGVIDVQGRILPVLSLRRRLALEERDIGVDDQFLIANTHRRSLVLVIDAAMGLLEVPAEGVMDARALKSGIEHISSIVSDDDGLLLIQDVERFLSAAEECALDTALQQDLQRAT